MRVVTVLLKLVFWTFALAVPLFGVWTSSSIAALQNGPMWGVLLAGLFFFPLGPILWELFAEARRQRRIAKRNKATGGHAHVPERILTFGDRIMLRTFLINAVFIGAMMWKAPTTVFTALSGRGDWMLDGRSGPQVDRARDILFGVADGLEWLYQARDENPFEGLAESQGEAPPPPPPTPEPEEPKPEEPKPEDPKPEDLATQDELGFPPAPDGYVWPSPEKAHPLALNPPESALVSVEALGHYIRDNESDQRMRIKAAHDWVALNIAYDVAGLNSGDYHLEQDSDTVFQNRYGVCAGYSNLMVALGEAMGEEIVYVGGFSREQDGSIAGSGHAWNATKVGDHWALIDATWDAGSVGPGGFKAGYETSYLFTPPEVFLLTHFPDEEGWQLVEKPVSRGEFTRAPMMRPSFFAHGFRLDANLRSQVTVDDELVLTIDNPKKRALSATYTARGGSSEQRCEVTGSTKLKVSCDFPFSGNYELILFAGEHRGTTLWSVGRLQVNATG